MRSLRRVRVSIAASKTPGDMKCFLTKPDNGEPTHYWPVIGRRRMAWLTEIHEYGQQDVVVMLLGNKVDSTHDRMVKREEGEKLAKEFGVPFMETSAKSGLNVELAFTAVAKELKHRTMKEPDEPKFQLQQYVDKEMRTAGCCRS
ncbi:hypothetical protein VZT92_012221 [Zoarces viviparus]|uniref:Ras-related protein Rab-26 n=2 Tax=Zoarces viviparus TaxID=48416 RepID=A0AAW1F8Q6_ZOAVI